MTLIDLYQIWCFRVLKQCLREVKSSYLSDCMRIWTSSIPSPFLCNTGSILCGFRGTSSVVVHFGYLYWVLPVQRVVYSSISSTCTYRILWSKHIFAPSNNMYEGWFQVINTQRHDFNCKEHHLLAVGFCTFSTNVASAKPTCKFSV